MIDLLNTILALLLVMNLFLLGTSRIYAVIHTVPHKASCWACFRC